MKTKNRYAMYGKSGTSMIFKVFEISQERTNTKY